MFASISASRRNADPLPYVLLDGTRAAKNPADPGNPEHWVTDAEGHALHLQHLADYAPRPEYAPAQSIRSNPLLDVARDNAGDADVWGWAMGWAFSANAVLEYLREPIAAERGYRASYAGAAADLADGSWEGAETLSVLGLGSVEVDPESGEPIVTVFDPAEVDDHAWLDAAAYAAHAAQVWDRYLAACRAAGLDY